MTVLLAKYTHKNWANSPKICVRSTQITLLEPLCRKKKQKYFISVGVSEYFQIFSSDLQICKRRFQPFAQLPDDTNIQVIHMQIQILFPIYIIDRYTDLSLCIVERARLPYCNRSSHLAPTHTSQPGEGDFPL